MSEKKNKTLKFNIIRSLSILITLLFLAAPASAGLFGDIISAITPNSPVAVTGAQVIIIPTCGNSVCEFGPGFTFDETSGSCAVDCFCGDGACNFNDGETAANCAIDCNPCSGVTPAGGVPDNSCSPGGCPFGQQCGITGSGASCGCLSLGFSENTFALCHNGVDEDLDGFLDCFDSSCATFCESTPAECNDGIDNNADGNLDCQDNDCVTTGFCGGVEPVCFDNTDGIIGNGQIDCADSACNGRVCATTATISTSCPSTTVGTVCTFCGDGTQDTGEQCDDGGVCTGDGTTPCTNTILDCLVLAGGPGGSCQPQSGDGCSQFCTIEQCGNSVVDPGEQCDDGNTVPDDGCGQFCQTEEADLCGVGNEATCCSDTIDNDAGFGSTGTDCGDPSCAGVQVPHPDGVSPDPSCEFTTELTCDDGFDNDNDGSFDCADSDCFTSSKCGLILTAENVVLTPGTTTTTLDISLDDGGVNHESGVIYIEYDGNDYDGNLVQDIVFQNFAALPAADVSTTGPTSTGCFVAGPIVTCEILIEYTRNTVSGSGTNVNAPIFELTFQVDPAANPSGTPLGAPAGGYYVEVIPTGQTLLSIQGPNTKVVAAAQDLFVNPLGAIDSVVGAIDIQAMAENCSNGLDDDFDGLTDCDDVDSCSTDLACLCSCGDVNADNAVNYLDVQLVLQGLTTNSPPGIADCTDQLTSKFDASNAPDGTVDISDAVFIADAAVGDQLVGATTSDPSGSGFCYGTPQSDSDGDGVSDGDEIVAGFDPLDITSAPNLDPDADGVFNDGDGSGLSGDNPCVGGNTVNCDDNCPNDFDPGQEDANSDGIGNLCDSDFCDNTAPVCGGHCSLGETCMPGGINGCFCDV